MDNPTPYSRWRDPIFLLILLVGFLLRFARLGFPEDATFDEIYYVPAAEDYLQGRPDSNSVHPPLAKLQMAAVILIADTLKHYGIVDFGHMVPGRLGCLIAGVGTIWLTHRLAYTLTGRRLFANFATLLVALDFLQIVESKIAMMDQIQTFWILAGFVFTAEVIFERKGFHELVFAALSFGIATACKWSGFFAAFGAWIALLGAVSREGETPIYPRRSVGHRIGTTLVFLFCGVFVYALSYIPFLMTEEHVTRGSIEKIVGFHKRMINFRYDEKQFTHRYLSPFYEWPLVARPVWYYYNEADGVVRGIVGMGNVVFWWPSLFLLIEAIWLGFIRPLRAPPVKAAPLDGEEPADGLAVYPRAPRITDPFSQFLCCSYFPQLLFWAIASTPGFIYYMLPMIPMMALAMARHLEELWAEKKGRYMAVLYLVILVATTAAFYPFLAGIAVPERYFRNLFLVDRWI